MRNLPFRFFGWGRWGGCSGWTVFWGGWEFSGWGRLFGTGRLVATLFCLNRGLTGWPGFRGVNCFFASFFAGLLAAGFRPVAFFAFRIGFPLSSYFGADLSRWKSDCLEITFPSQTGGASFFPAPTPRWAGWGRWFPASGCLSSFNLQNLFRTTFEAEEVEDVFSAQVHENLQAELIFENLRLEASLLWDLAQVKI